MRQIVQVVGVESVGVIAMALLDNLQRAFQRELHWQAVHNVQQVIGFQLIV